MHPVQTGCGNSMLNFAGLFFSHEAKAEILHFMPSLFCHFSTPPPQKKANSANPSMLPATQIFPSSKHSESGLYIWYKMQRTDLQTSGFNYPINGTNTV